MTALNRSVKDQYLMGEYHQALKLAQHAQSEIREFLGTDHPALASAHNNVSGMPSAVLLEQGFINGSGGPYLGVFV